MKMVSINYRFNSDGVSGVDVGFEDWDNQDVSYNITVKLNKEDTDLANAIPSQLETIAKAKVANLATE